MIIRCLGHAKFSLTLENGVVLVTDPFDPSVGYPVTPMKADAVTISHGHHDHSAAETVQADTVIDTPGIHTLPGGITVTGIPSFHDAEGGTRRGKNIIFRFEAEGLTVAHLGDLGHVLTEEQLQALGHIDILMIPVGGFFTIDGETAAEVARQIRPRIVLPMHYKTAVNPNFPVSDEKPFLKAYSRSCETLPLLRVTQADLSCQPETVILTV